MAFDHAVDATTTAGDPCRGMERGAWTGPPVLTGYAPKAPAGEDWKERCGWTTKKSHGDDAPRWSTWAGEKNLSSRTRGSCSRHCDGGAAGRVQRRDATTIERDIDARSRVRDGRGERHSNRDGRSAAAELLLRH